MQPHRMTEKYWKVLKTKAARSSLEKWLWLETLALTLATSGVLMLWMFPN